MEIHRLIEHVKKVGKQMKKACPVEIGLAHAHTALAQALGFPSWYQLAKSLPAESSAVFQSRVLKLSTNPTDPTFLQAVKRFSDSANIDLAIAHALCVEFLPPALEKWQTWDDWRPDTKKPAEPDAKNSDRPPTQWYSKKESEESRPLLAALVGLAGVRLISQGHLVPVVVRKKRRTFQS